MTAPSTAQRAATAASTGSPSSTNASVRPRTPARLRTAAPAAFRTDSASAVGRLPRPTTATRRARTLCPSVCSTVTWPAAPRISPAFTSRPMVPPSARSSSATAPSRTTGLATATASMSTLAVAGAAAEVEIFMGPRCGREREPRKGIRTSCTRDGTRAATPFQASLNGSAVGGSRGLAPGERRAATPPGSCESVDDDLVAVVEPAVAVQAVEVDGDARTLVDGVHHADVVATRDLGQGYVAAAVYRLADDHCAAAAAGVRAHVEEVACVVDGGGVLHLATGHHQRARLMGRDLVEHHGAVAGARGIARPGRPVTRDAAWE